MTRGKKVGEEGLNDLLEMGKKGVDATPVGLLHSWAKTKRYWI